MILCFKCGVPTEPTIHNLCNRCTSMTVTSSSKIRKAVAVEWCKGCERYLSKPRTWNKYDWGSRDLLIYLIKSNSSLNGCEIFDSNFVYTEEHSKRIILKVVIETCGIREDVDIKYTIRNKQCPDCEKIEAKQHWNAVVQVRHRMMHQRIFIQLEQLILKNKMLHDTTNIKTRKGGIDFYFTDRTAATKLVNFIETVMPVKIILSERLISRDIQNARDNYKFSYSVEIASLAVDDVVLLQKSFACSLGINNLVIVKKISSTIVVLDVSNLKTVKISNTQYWANKDKFSIIVSSKSFVKFNVIECGRPLFATVQHQLIPITVTRDDNTVIETKTHLGRCVQEDDVILGYDLTNLNSTYKTQDVPDIILVRKDVPRDIKWKTPVTSDEYFYYLQDVIKDKEIVNNLCTVEVENKQLIDKVQDLLK